MEFLLRLSFKKERFPSHIYNLKMSFESLSQAISGDTASINSKRST